MTGVSKMDALKSTIKAEAEKLGFCFCAFTDCAPPEDHPRYRAWIEEDQYGTMSFMAREDHLAKRADPLALFPQAKSICVLGVPYDLQNDPSIASYAFYRDYHEQIPRRIDCLMQRVINRCGMELQWKNFTDSAPLLERSLAMRAGVGWIGKSSMLIHPKFGSAFLLAECFLDQAIEADAPFTRDLCGSCDRCVKSCPTHCIDPKSRTIHAEKCVSYLTIEHKGDFSETMQEAAKHSIFGCDRCLAVCPWNQRRGNVGTFLDKQPFIPNLSDLNISDEIFKERFKGSAFFRTKNRGLQRNLRNYIQHNEKESTE